MGKEREERVRLELKATELEEELETQASHISSVKWVELHTHIVTTHTVCTLQPFSMAYLILA